MQIKRVAAATAGVLATAAIAWAAASANFINDPAVFDQGGGIAGSANFDTHGSIGGVAISADIGGGNQSGTASSANFINVVGFPEGAAPGGATTAPPVYVAAGSANPQPTVELDATTATLPMLQFVVNADVVGDAFITSFTFTASGTGDDSVDTSGVDLYIDTNGNGRVDGSETTVATQQTYSADNGTVTFTPSSPIQVLAGTSVTFLVTYTYAGSATAGDTFTCTLAAGGLLVEDSSAVALVPSGLPQAGGTKTMAAAGGTGALSLVVGADNPGGTALGGGGSQIPWFQFSLGASTLEAVTLNTLVFTASGTMNDAVDITNVRLFIDNGVQPGAVDSGDTALATGNYTGDNGTVTFLALNQAIAAGGWLDLLVAYDLAGTVEAGDIAGITIVNPTDVTGTGGTSTNTVAITGTPAGSVRFIATVGPSTISTPGSSGGGGCVMVTSGSGVPAGAPLGTVLPWLLAFAALLFWRRRTL